MAATGGGTQPTLLARLAEMTDPGEARGEAIHGLHPYPAKYIPALVIADLTILNGIQGVERRDMGDNYNRHGFVFVGEGGRPMRPETYSRLFSRHAVAAELPKIRLHDLRHTAASLLASQGVPIITAAALLGHDPQVFAEIYAHHYPDDLKRASNTLTDVYARAG